MTVVYATREQVQDSMEMTSTPRADRLTDQKLGAATQMIEAMLRRKFYPKTETIKFDWPSYQHSTSWTFYFEDNEFVSIDSVVTGGTTMDPSTYFLRRSDNGNSPPFDMLQVDMSTAASFSVGTTFQRSLQVTGPTGYNATDLSVAAASLSSGINGSVSQITLKPVNSVLDVGVGSLAVIGSERFLVTNRLMADSGYTVQSDIDDDMAAAVIDVIDGTKFAAGEVILIDSERMHIDEIAGNNLIVTRAWDGSALATHEQATTIYARRTYNVTRAALGSTAAAHSTDDNVYVHQYPALVNELCIAETTVLIEQSSTAYARQSGSGANARQSAGQGLDDLRNQARIAFSRERMDAI